MNFFFRKAMLFCCCFASAVLGATDLTFEIYFFRDAKDTLSVIYTEQDGVLFGPADKKNIIKSDIDSKKIHFSPIATLKDQDKWQGIWVTCNLYFLTVDGTSIENILPGDYLYKAFTTPEDVRVTKIDRDFFRAKYYSATENNFNVIKKSVETYLSEKLFAHATHIGSIKEELVKTAGEFEARNIERRKKDKIAPYPPIVPAPVTQKPPAKTFEYSQSMVDLAYFSKGKIALLPKPNDKTKTTSWFWNDGVYTDKKQLKYQVTYDQKIWKSTDGGMPYITYYRYLVEKKQNLEPFIRHLIKQAIEKYPSDFNLNYKLDNTQKILYLTDLFTKIILEEENNRDKYVFYSGYSGGLELAYAFITILTNYLTIEKRHLERSVFEKLTSHRSAKELLEASSTTDDWALRPYLMSTNVALFGNLMDPGECTVNYFCSNISMGNLRAKADKKKEPSVDIIENLCQAIGLTYNDKIKQLSMGYKQLGGRLKQLFIPAQYVDTITHLSRAYGKLYNTKNTNDLIKCLVQSFAKKEDVNDDDYELLTTSNVLNLMKSDPTHKCFANHSKFINVLQARILHFHPLFFDPEISKQAGMQILYYFTDKSKSTEQNKLRKELDLIVRHMIWNALENGTLKPQDVKLKTLYAAMKKPIPQSSKLSKTEFEKQKQGPQES